MKRALRWTLWCVVVLAILSVAAWTILNVVAKSRLERAISGMRASGRPASGVEIAPPPAKPEENAAPLYAAAFAMLGDPDGEIPGQAEDGFASLTKEQKDVARAWFARQHEAFDLLRRARSRPRSRFERDYSLGFSMPLPEIRGAIRTTRILAARVESLVDEGKADQAQQVMRDLMGVAESMREEPLLVSQLVRIVCWNWILESLSRCVTAETGVDDLRAWRDVLPPDRFQGMLVTAFRGEAAFGADWLMSSADLPLLTGKQPGPFNFLLRPVYRLDGVRYLDAMSRLADLSGLPYPQAQEAMLRPEGEILPQSQTWTKPVVGPLLPQASRCITSVATVLARLAVVRAGLSFEIARSSTAYPDRVEEIDPFTERPLLLRDGRIASACERETIEWKLRRP